MGVKKYRSVEDMPGPPPRRPLDPDNLRLVLGMMELARRLSPRPRTPGVRKFASHDQMLRERKLTVPAPAQPDREHDEEPRRPG